MCRTMCRPPFAREAPPDSQDGHACGRGGGRGRGPGRRGREAETCGVFASPADATSNDSPAVEGTGRAARAHLPRNARPRHTRVYGVRGVSSKEDLRISPTVTSQRPASTTRARYDMSARCARAHTHTVAQWARAAARVANRTSIAPSMTVDTFVVPSGRRMEPGRKLWYAEPASGAGGMRWPLVALHDSPSPNRTRSPRPP